MRMRFTEQMRGFHTPGSAAYEEAYESGQRDRRGISFELTIGTDDLGASLRDPVHRMRARGYVRCRDLHVEDMPVEDGTFDLFAPTGADGRTLMRYRLPVTTTAGPMTVLGVKEVHNDRGTEMWSDTTTLFARVVRGTAEADERGGDEYSRGILRLGPLMLARQVTTFRGSPLGIARFLVFFEKGLLRTYGRPPRAD
jgi:hypothetical protein